MTTRWLHSRLEVDSEWPVELLISVRLDSAVVKAEGYRRAVSFGEQFERRGASGARSEEARYRCVRLAALLRMK